MLLLPDISEYQSSANLKAIKEANGGAIIIRAAYGANYPDPCFARFRAQAAGLGYSFCGLYQYVTENQNIEVQADAFVKIVGKLGPHEVPILDLEEGPGNQESRANAWLNVVDSAFGLTRLALNKRSWLYSGEAFAEEHGLAPIFTSARHTWVAAYGDTEPALGHTLWQCSSAGVGSHVTTWPGCGECDTNLYHGDLTQLASLITR